MTKIRSKKTKNKKMLEMRTLEIALIFRDLNEIYFPVKFLEVGVILLLII